MNELLIAGLFRSGTTLLSRVLGSRPDALLVADPFVYLFRGYRNALLEEAGASGWRPDEPTSDLFRAPHHAVWRDLVLRRDLRERVAPAALERLRADLREWKGEQHPRLCARLDELDGATWAELWRGLLALCLELYRPAGGVTLAGGKVSWCEEFLPALARAFPRMRFVVLVRDVRAVCASQSAREGSARGKRPLLFYARHWRKCVGLALRHARDPLLAGRLTLVRYEDLVARPAEVVRELCRRLDVRFGPDLLDAGGFRAVDEQGTWRANSSFEGGEGIFTASLARWRTALRPPEIAALEALCGPELAVMGYERTLPPLRPEACAASGCEPAFEELAPWLRPFATAQVLREPEALAREYAAEGLRLDVLSGARRVSAEEEERLFLDRSLVPLLRAGRADGAQAAREPAARSSAAASQRAR